MKIFLFSFLLSAITLELHAQKPLTLSNLPGKIAVISDNDYTCTVYGEK